MSLSSSSISPTDESTFTISAVAKLTGISEHCLRIWERRYQVVEPIRTDTKRRRYTHKDIERLVLIKHLVDSGDDTISKVAPLNLEQLRERSNHYPNTSRANSHIRTIKLAVIGEHITTFLDEHATTSAKLEIVRTYSSISEYLKTIPHPKIEIMIFDFATVYLQTISDIEEVLKNSSAHKAILIYDFAARPALDRLDRNRITPLRSPVDPHEIRIACADPHMISATHEVTPTEASSKIDPIPHRYNADQLATLASIASPVNCEFPQHLVTLIFALNTFEKHSNECANISNDNKELHTYLHHMSSRARATIEEALAKVAKSHCTQA